MVWSGLTWCSTYIRKVINALYARIAEIQGFSRAARSDFRGFCLGDQLYSELAALLAAR